MNEVKLSQIKLNAIVAKKLHNIYLKKYDTSKKIFTAISIILPILITFLMYFSKGKKIQPYVEFFSFVSSIGLIIYSVILLILNIDEKLIQHKIYVNKNIDIITEADNLLNEKDCEQAVINWFSKYVSEMDKKDNELLNSVNDEDRKYAYREALKENDSGNSDVVCPICKKSPWKYIKGDCQLCGNKIGE